MATSTESTSAASTQGGGEVIAAGTLCWRIEKGQLQVLIIHRPRYRDWSWPKGKLDPGETTPECAIRETFEEVGLSVKLGIPLATITYPVSSRDKVVLYWAARTDRLRPVPDGKEVDRVQWVSPEEARDMLSNPSDVEPLDALVAAHAAKDLQTWPLIVVRHAKAKPRSSWSRAEGDRPLAATGRRQAIAVSRLLQAWNPERVVSSPWERCVQTISPYVNQRSAKLKLVDALTEHDAARRPGRAKAAVERVFDKRRPVALCTHRPVLPLVFAVLGDHMPAGLRQLLPVDDPYLAPGEAVICQVSSANPGRIVSVEQFRAYDD
ncbi:NUDIX hydrolase [Arthrobacter agilis]|jgi:8-oxo-dGTP diphosphatase|uniref:NUDIX hydrolase n=1 Tax=Arthrobacter agilis TaxID=37921 RepID=UPI0027867F97|nr:NUDIX hydrolase [Arthrobacter agilis]MDQ0735841.1 8-oxo-dGTP pyrophosphatase MutT (NUDIX family)/broad specificity phosphatase PhoE [Arthrobacter agilis]